MRRSLVLVAVAGIAATAAPAAHAAPTCSKTSAMDRIEANAPFVAAIRKTGALQPDESVSDVFGIADITCADLTGDKRKEMTVTLDCCTAASPTPFAIFTAKDDGWKLAYRTTKLLISDQRRKGQKIILTHPVYKRTDALCCPSSMRDYTVAYKDGEFHRRAST
ncbi:MAG: hypothetical protein QOF76_4437 [Solirubrobacteraceae bacterium]|jgi:hypothetical protein|nr:hypothetical protein [Solirubrobacteraceae bacterium]